MTKINNLPYWMDRYTLPSSYAPALIDNDFSGLNDQEIEELHEWLTETNPGSCVSCSEDEWFSWGHDMNLQQGATVCHFYFDNRNRRVDD